MELRSLTLLLTALLVSCGAKAKEETVSAKEFQKLYREVGTDTDKRKVEYIGQFEGKAEIYVTLRDWADEWVIQSYSIDVSELPPAFLKSLPQELDLDR